jgi:hypothetical protein
LREIVETSISEMGLSRNLQLRIKAFEVQKLKKVLKRFFWTLLILLLLLFVMGFIYGELIGQENSDPIHYPPYVRGTLWNFAQHAANYLYDIPEPEQGVNLVNKLKPYILDSLNDPDLPRLESGRYSFYVSGDLAWVGHELPKIFWTKGNNKSRKKLERQTSTSRFYYGSKSMNSPPPDDSEQYYYKQEDDAIWLKVDKRWARSIKGF